MLPSQSEAYWTDLSSFKGYSGVFQVGLYEGFGGFFVDSKCVSHRR